MLLPKLESWSWSHNQMQLWTHLNLFPRAFGELTQNISRHTTTSSPESAASTVDPCQPVEPCTLDPPDNPCEGEAPTSTSPSVSRLTSVNLWNQVNLQYQQLTPVNPWNLVLWAHLTSVNLWNQLHHHHPTPQHPQWNLLPHFQLMHYLLTVHTHMMKSRLQRLSFIHLPPRAAKKVQKRG